MSAGGIGFDAQVAAAMADRARWQRGRAGYLLTTLSELRRFTNRSIEITVDGGARIARQVLFVAIANGANYGGGMRIAPDAQLDDGWLDLCIVGNISRLGALRQMPNLHRGTHTAHPAVELMTARTVQIDGRRQHANSPRWRAIRRVAALHRARAHPAVRGDSAALGCRHDG